MKRAELEASNNNLRQIIADQQLQIATLEREFAAARVAQVRVTSLPTSGDLIRAEIERRMGMCPSFFRLASADPKVLRGLSDVATAAYLDSDPPALFKEILFTYLSRYCDVRYCVARHAGFLLGHGYVAGNRDVPPLALTDVVRLLSEPLPEGDQLKEVNQRLKHREPLTEWPDLLTDDGRDFRIGCAMVFRFGANATAWSIVLRRLLGAARYSQLMFLLGFIRLAHFWTEVHPELQWESDLNELAEQQGELASALLALGNDINEGDIGSRVFAEADELTEALRLMDALRQSEERWKLALEATDAGAYELNLQDYTLWRSPQYDRIFGYNKPQGNWSYERFLAHVHADDRSRVDSAFQEAIRQGRDWVFECRICGNDGDIRYVRSIGRSRYDEDRRPTLMWGIVEDVTTKRQSEDALREAARRKDEFLAVLGHELRNPLAPLSSGLELLKTADGKPELTTDIRVMMERQLGHLVRLVDDLLDLSRVTRGLVELQLAPIDLWSAIEAGVEQVKSLASARAQELIIKQPNRPLPIEADLARLTQVFVNLLSNAAKYSEPGGTIKVWTEVDGDDVVVRIRDSGFGIPPQRRDALFEMFNQIPEHRERTGGGGLGIGLAVSRRFVQMHGGSIEVASEGLDKGAEFSVALTLRRASTDSSQAAEVDEELATQRRVLVVDDNIDAADALSMALSLRGHVVRAVYGGEAALECMDAFEPEVVLLDIGLPNLNGYEVAKRIHELRSGSAIKLFALTGWGQEEDKQRALAAGFDQHLTKPVDLAVLTKLMNDITTASVG